MDTEAELRQLRYRVEVEQQHHMWRERIMDIVDATHPMAAPLYIPVLRRLVEKVYLSLRLLPLRYYDAAGGAVATGATATGVTVTIDGTDRTVALTGGATINASVDELDITQYVTGTGWHTVSLASSGLGTIEALYRVEIYLPQ